MTAADRSLAESAARLSQLLFLNGPIPVVNQECNLLLKRMTDRLGPAVVRRWLNEYMDFTAAALTADDGTECPDCRGLGARFTADGINPQCRRCRGVGVV